MISGIGFTAAYIVYFKFMDPAANVPDRWLFGISPEGIGILGMALNFAVSSVVACMTAPPPEAIRQLVDEIRVPADAGPAHEIRA
jgi:cation/acetate symporter